MWLSEQSLFQPVVMQDLVQGLLKGFNWSAILPFMAKSNRVEQAGLV
jgi:hypothetical protein